jgi:hypothetical protein
VNEPADILRDAEQLSGAITTEARRRTILSRAYYAALHYLKLHPCAAEFRDRPGRSIHRSLVEHLAQSKNRSVTHCARLLIRLRGRRELADYYLGDTITAAMAEEALEDAREIIEEALVDYRAD